LRQLNHHHPTRLELMISHVCHTHRKRRLLIKLDATDDDAQSIISKIPTDKESLFAVAINWVAIDKVGWL